MTTYLASAAERAVERATETGTRAPHVAITRPPYAKSEA